MDVKLSFVAGFALLCAQAVNACECISTRLKDEYKCAAAVFVGTALTESSDTTRWTFRIDEAFKGPAAGTTVKVHYNPCDYMPFTEGGRSVVLARLPDPDEVRRGWAEPDVYLASGCGHNFDATETRGIEAIEQLHRWHHWWNSWLSGHCPSR